MAPVVLVLLIGGCGGGSSPVLGSARLAPGSEARVAGTFADLPEKPAEPAALFDAQGNPHPDHPRITLGSRVRVVSDDQAEQIGNRGAPDVDSVRVDRRKVQVEVLDGPQAGARGFLARHLLNPQEPRPGG